MLREGGHQVGVLQNSTGHPADGKVTSPSVTLYQSSPSMDHMSTNAGGNLHPSLPHHVGTPAASAASPSHMGTPGSTAAPTPSGTGTASNTAVGGPGGGGGPQQQQQAPPPLSAANTSAASGSSVHSTPRTPNATLKRKAADIHSQSPTAETAQQPAPKRAQRKRSMRQTNNPGPG